MAWGLCFASLFSAKSFSVPSNLQTCKQTWKTQLVNSLDSLFNVQDIWEGEEDTNLCVYKRVITVHSCRKKNNGLWPAICYSFSLSLLSVSSWIKGYFFIVSTFLKAVFCFFFSHHTLRDRLRCLFMKEEKGTLDLKSNPIWLFFFLHQLCIMTRRASEHSKF